MMHDVLPRGLKPMGCSRTFTEASVPEALQMEHTLGSGRWAVLQVLEGSVSYVDLADSIEHLIQAPNRVIIGPEAPHRLILSGPLSCRIDFFCE